MRRKFSSLSKIDPIKLVTFGDSWPVGSELAANEVPYGKLLAAMLQADFQNYAQPGTSNDHQIFQLKTFLEKNDPSNTIAVFFITSPARTLVLEDDGKTKKIIYPWADMSRGEVSYYYFKYFHNPPFEQFRLHLSVLSMQRICQMHGIRDFYIVGWSKCNFDFPGIDESKIFKQGAVTCADLLGVNGEHEFSLASENQYVYPNHCHPNQQGHKLIAQTLFEWIKDKIV